MKLIFTDRFDLQDAFTRAALAASAKSPERATEGVLIEANAGADEAHMTGFNFQVGIRTSVYAQVEQPGVCLLDAKLFSELIRKLPDGEVVLDAGDESVSVSCGRAKFNLQTLPAEEFPQLPCVDGNKSESLAVPAKSLCDALGGVLFAVSTNEARPIHTGVLFDCVASCKMNLVAVDGYRLALRSVNGTEGSETASFVVPAFSLNQLLKFASSAADEQIFIQADKKYAHFKVGDTEMLTRILEGQFLDYKTAVPKNQRFTLAADTRAMRDCFDRVSLLSSEKAKTPVRCLFGSGTAKFSAQSALGSSSDEMQIDGDANDLEIGFNHRYVLDALRHVSEQKINLRMENSVSPLVMEPCEPDGDFLYMVLPVRLRAA